MNTTATRGNRRLNQLFHPSSSSRRYAQYSDCASNEVLITVVGPFRFAKPLSFQIERTDDGIIMSNKESDLIAYGDSMKNARMDLQSEIEMAWEEYALEDDSKLDNVAREYKRWLIENVKKRD